MKTSPSIYPKKQKRYDDVTIIKKLTVYTGKEKTHRKRDSKSST